MSGTFVHLCANALVIVFKIRSHFASRADSMSWMPITKKQLPRPRRAKQKPCRNFVLPGGDYARVHDGVHEPASVPEPSSPRCSKCARRSRSQRECNRCGCMTCLACVNAGARCPCYDYSDEDSDGEMNLKVSDFESAATTNRAHPQTQTDAAPSVHSAIRGSATSHQTGRGGRGGCRGRRHIY